MDVHEVVGHPLILSSVSGSELVTVLLEVQVTLKTIGEWHDGLRLSTKGSNGESTSSFEELST